MPAVPIYVFIATLVEVTKADQYSPLLQRQDKKDLALKIRCQNTKTAKITERYEHDFQALMQKEIVNKFDSIGNVNSFCDEALCKKNHKLIGTTVRQHCVQEFTRHKCLAQAKVNKAPSAGKTMPCFLAEMSHKGSSPEAFRDLIQENEKVKRASAEKYRKEHPDLCIQNSSTGQVECDPGLAVEKKFATAWSSRMKKIAKKKCEDLETRHTNTSPWGPPNAIPSWFAPKVSCGQATAVTVLARRMRAVYMQHWFTEMEKELDTGENQWFAQTLPRYHKMSRPIQPVDVRFQTPEETPMNNGADARFDDSIPSEYIPPVEPDAGPQEFTNSLKEKPEDEEDEDESKEDLATEKSQKPAGEEEEEVQGHGERHKEETAKVEEEEHEEKPAKAEEKEHEEEPAKAKRHMDDKEPAKAEEEEHKEEPAKAKRQKDDEEPPKAKGEEHEEEPAKEKKQKDDEEPPKAKGEEHEEEPEKAEGQNDDKESIKTNREEHEERSARPGVEKYLDLLRVRTEEERENPDIFAPSDSMQPITAFLYDVVADQMSSAQPLMNSATSEVHQAEHDFAHLPLVKMWKLYRRDSRVCLPTIIGYSQWKNYLNSPELWNVDFWKLISPANVKRMIAESKKTKEFCAKLEMSTVDYRVTAGHKSETEYGVCSLALIISRLEAVQRAKTLAIKMSLDEQRDNGAVFGPNSARPNSARVGRTGRRVPGVRGKPRSQHVVQISPFGHMRADGQTPSERFIHDIRPYLHPHDSDALPLQPRHDAYEYQSAAQMLAGSATKPHRVPQGVGNMEEEESDVLAPMFTGQFADGVLKSERQQ